jgi:hypothetical protein
MKRRTDVKLLEGQTVRVIVPGGTVEISAVVSHTPEGDPVNTVDIVADQVFGRMWKVVRGAADGCVRMVGFKTEENG